MLFSDLKKVTDFFC